MLLGEGANDLGRWAAQPPYREDDDRVGVIEALLRRCGAGWEIADGRVWKAVKATAYRAGQHAGLEQRRILRALQDLREADADIDALVFVRDRDGDEGREADILRAIEVAKSQYRDFRVCGGVAVECIEAWVLGCMGQLRAESQAVETVQARLARELGFEPKTNDLSDRIAAQPAADVAVDASSLKKFCADLTAMLATA